MKKPRLGRLCGVHVSSEFANSSVVCMRSTGLGFERGHVYQETARRVGIRPN